MTKFYSTPSAATLKNKTFALIGLSGHGKSTLANCLVNRSGKNEDLVAPFLATASPKSVTTSANYHTDEANNMHLFDTPGFGTPEFSNTEILEKLQELLQSKMANVKLVHGILFVVSADRFGNDFLDCLSFIKKQILKIFKKNIFLILTKSRSNNWLNNNKDDFRIKEALDLCQAGQFEFYLQMDSEADDDQDKARNLTKRQKAVDELIEYFAKRFDFNSMNRNDEFPAVNIESIKFNITIFIDTLPHRKKDECFAAGSTVYVKGRGLALISSLADGDYVRTLSDQGLLEFSRFICYLHIEKELFSEFLCLITESNKSIKITPMHLIARFNTSTERIEFTFANKIKVGDDLVGDQLSNFERVVKIETCLERGVFAPLTESGTLLVDSILASCYANVSSQRIAHAAFWPIRVAKSCVKFSELNTTDKDKKKLSGTEPVFWYAKFLRDTIPFGSKFYVH